MAFSVNTGRWHNVSISSATGKGHEHFHKRTSSCISKTGSQFVNCHYTTYDLGALQFTLPVCGFKPRLVQIFKRICFRFLNFGILFRCLCSWARQLTLTRFAWPKCKWVPGRTEMKICMINVMRRNGYRTVYSPWIRNGTRINNSSFKWRKKETDKLAVYMVYGRLTQRGIDFRRNLCKN